MKRIFVFAILVASGIGTAMGAGAVVTSGEAITTTDCSLLAESVTIALSANVHAAYKCDEATSVAVVGACHKGGDRAAAGDCVVVNNQGTTVTTDDTYNYSACTAQLVADSEPPPGDIIDYSAYTGSTSGGSLGQSKLGGKCDDGTIVGVTAFD